MKHVLLTVIMLATVLIGSLNAQTVVYSEGFEGTLTVTSSSSSSNAWAVNTSLQASGLKSDSCVVSANDTIILTTNAFATTGFPSILLEFDHICKIHYLDAGYIEVSNDNGANWTQLLAGQYLGTSQFGTAGNKFNSLSYVTDWQASTGSAIPTNSWWKHEIFDISTLADSAAQVKVRFRLVDGDGNGAASNYGWLIDNIKVTTAISELQSPTASYNSPMIVDTVYNTGPWNILATITDASGIDTAMLIYKHNSNAWDTVGMYPAGSIYNGLIDTIPGQPYAIGDTFRYYVVAIDASLSHNVTTLQDTSFILATSPPPPGCTSPITTFPFIENFESGTAGNGTPSNAGTLPTGWTRTPSSGSSIYMHLVRTGATSSSSTGPTGDHTTGSGKYVYGEVSYGSSGQIAYTQSPCFDISSVSAPQLVFWYHMYGSVISTFTVQIWYGGVWVDIWAKSGNQGNLWKKAIVSLVPYKGITKLRFKTKSLGCCAGDIAFDDIKIWVPPANDAGVTALNNPITPAISGTIPVHATVKNFGSANLTSVNVNWQVNGVTQTPISWTGIVSPMQTLDSILIGSYAFTAGAPVIKLWTSSPNGAVDGFTYNDTLNTSVVVCDGNLHGTYTVGGATADFFDVVSAVSALNNCGIDSSVVFNINSGTYTGQLEIGVINGVSDTSTITFQSLTGNPADVIIEYTSLAAVDNYTIQLDGAKYMMFKNLTIKNNGPVFSYVFDLKNGADYNTFEGNIIRGGNISSGSSRAVNAFNTSFNYNTFKNNDISNCFYGLILRGPTTYTVGNSVINNTIHDITNYAIYSYYQDSMIIASNTIYNLAYASARGLQIYNPKNGFRIISNSIKLASSNYAYGMYIYRMNYQSASTSDTCIIANNMVSILGGTGSNYGIQLNNCELVHLVYNNILINGGNVNSRALFQTGSSSLSSKIKILNNNFVTIGGGYSMYINTASNIASCNYNNYYTTGSKFTYWGGPQNTLASLKTASNDNNNSVNVDPEYVSNTNLHTTTVDVYQKGVPFPNISVDFDGDIRSATIPCIGADEFTLVNNDAGITALISPTIVCPGDTANIIVKLQNFGLDTLFSCTINWKINGVTQTPFLYSDTLLHSEKDSVTIGSYVYSNGIIYDMEFFTTLPNGVADIQNANDSLVISGFRTAFSAGTYTIGHTASADYNSIDSLIIDLNTYGICGPVVFNIDTGVYTGRIVLNNIIGASAINTMTFKSAGGDSSAVIINYSVQGSPAIIALSNMSYVTIKGITFNVIGTNTGRGIALWGNSTHNKFESCVFNIDQTATSNNVAGIYFNNASIKFNKFINNKFNGGYYGAYCKGSSTINRGESNELINNQFIGFRNYGIYLYYQDSSIIKGNHFSDNGHYNSPRGIHAYYNYGPWQIVGNTITLSGSSYSYGMYCNNSVATANSRGLIANNMISINGGTSTNYGIYFSNGSYQNIVNNSISVLGGNTASRCIYITQGNNNEFINNILYANNGYAAYINTISALGTMDYNNYYTTGSRFVYYLGQKTNLADLKVASNKDAHSKEVNPGFISNTNLHLVNGAMNAAGDTLSYITMDIDYELRDTANPDIGADEFTPPAQDISIINIDSDTSYCGASLINVITTVVNTGIDTISGNLVLKYSLDSGATWVSENITTTIAPSDTLRYTFSTQADISSSQDTNIRLIVKGILPLDPIAFNDSLYVNIFNGIIPTSPIVASGITTYSNTATLSATSSNSILWYLNDTIQLPLFAGNSYNTPILFDTSVYYCAVQGTNGCFSARVPDTAYVTGIPSGDVGISAIYVNEGCGIDSTETISIDIYNQGYGTVSGNLTAKYRIDNNPYITPEAVSVSIPSNSTITYSFTTKANLYAYYGDTLFSMDAVVNLAGDPYHVNDSISKDTIEVYFTPKVPTVTSPMAVGFGSYASLVATSPNNLNWYNSNSVIDTVPIGTGSPLSVGPIWITDSFYVEAAGIVGGVFNAGTGTNNNTNTSYPSPYGQFYTGSKEQYLILASELTALGATGGPIASIAFDVVAVNSPTSAGHNHDNYTIKLANTSANTLSSWQSGLTQVFTTSSYQTVTGWNTHTFQTPFVWDGTSNLVIETCFDNFVSGSSYSLNAVINRSSTPFVSTRNFHSDVGGVCANNGGNSYTIRPNIQITIIGTDCRSDRVELVVNVGAAPPVDAGMDSLISPTLATSVSAGSPVPIICKIKSYGTSNLTAVDITYELDGDSITTYAWTGSLSQFAISNAITIYTDTVKPGLHNYRLWVSNANGSDTAGVNLNDTLVGHFIACFNGTYTIGDTTADFTTFADALTALNDAGVCGNVTFNVLSGTYTEQLAIQPYTGLDANNTITFQSLTGDSTDVTIQYTPPAYNYNYTVAFFGCNYVTFRNMTIKASGTYSHTIIYYNNASHNTVENCIIESAVSTSSYACPFYDFNNSNSQYNTVRNNKILNGSYAFYLYGVSTANKQTGFVIENNEVSGWASYGLYCRNLDSLIVKNNTFTPGSNAVAIPRGLYLYYVDGASEIINNKVLLSPSNYSWGYYLYRFMPSASKPAIVANNVISIDGGTGNSYGMYVNYTYNTNFYHNSVNLVNTSTNSRALYQTQGANLSFVNNAFANNNGYAIYVQTPNAIGAFDYNDIYSQGSNYAYWSGNRTSLSVLKTASNKNAHSIDGNPMFYSSTNLHTGSPALNNTGYALAAVPFDADGKTRSTTTPDIGAYEFTPLALDGGIVNLANPISGQCFGANETVEVKFQNFGTDTIFFAVDTAVINVSVTGPNPLTFPSVTLNSGFLVNGADSSVSITNNYNMSLSGTYTFSVNSYIRHDSNAINDVMIPSSIAATSTISVFPFNEDFETFTTGYPGTFANGWLPNNPGSYRWQVNSGQTSSSNTGPTGDHTTGNGIYVYAEASSSGGPANLVSPCIDLSSFNTPVLKYWYHMYGATMASLYVQILDTNGVWSNVDVISGQQQTSSNAPWLQRTVSIAGFNNGITKIRFHAIKGSSYTSDICIDDVYINEPKQWDIGVKNVRTTPTQNFSMIGSVLDTIVLKIENYGYDTITPSTGATVSINYGGNTTVINIVDTILPYQHIFIRHSTPTTVLLGNNDITVYTTYALDSVTNNDTNIVHYMGVSVFPLTYNNNFDGNIEFFTDDNTCWQRGAPNGTNITSPHSSPNVWMTTLTNGYPNNANCYVYTPFFDFSSVLPNDTATLSFYHFVDALSGDGGKVQYSLDNGNTWLNLGYKGAGQPATNWYNIGGANPKFSYTNSGWQYSDYKFKVPASATGPVQFRFKFMSNAAGNTGDGWAIDDFKITLPIAPYDAGADTITLPATGTTIGSSGNTVTAIITNYGSNSLGNIPVSYQINGTTIASENFLPSGGLASGASAQYTFTTAYQGPPSNYRLCVITNQPNDPYHQNDSAFADLLATTPNYDAEVSKVEVAPIWGPNNDTTKTSFLTEVKITIKNNGLMSISNFPVKYYRANLPYANETFTATIASGDSAIFTFDTTYYCPVGNYTICGEIDLPNDANSANDKLCLSLIGKSDVSIDNANGLVFEVSQNEPNPARGIVRINYVVPTNDNIRFELRNTLGQIVYSEQQASITGSNTIEVDASKLANGVYYYTVEYNNERITRKMIVNK